MTRAMQSSTHLKMAVEGYVSHRAAALALGVSMPTMRRRVLKSKLKTIRAGNALYVLWAPLRKLEGPSADLLHVPMSALEVAKAFVGKRK